MVFLDDNPFERALIRRELPMVAVPEVPDEPALFIDCLADAGYFESLALTGEDWQRKDKYRDNQAREKFRGTVTDMKSYLAGLDMKLIWRRFDRVGLARIVQLINKTNQFNLTTRRYSEEDVLGMIAANDVVGLQCRLVDRFGDNGIIAILIGRLQGSDLSIDTWLMSCRVLGRQVEQTTLELIADQARSVGATRLIGEFIPTKKNGMVSNHYQSLGFSVLETQANGRSKYSLDLNAYAAPSTFVELIEDVADDRSTNLRHSVQHI
jgi:FkbH-like protein